MQLHRVSALTPPTTLHNNVGIVRCERWQSHVGVSLSSYAVRLYFALIWSECDHAERCSARYNMQWNMQCKIQHAVEHAVQHTTCTSTCSATCTASYNMHCIIQHASYNMQCNMQHAVQHTTRSVHSAKPKEAETRSRLASLLTVAVSPIGHSRLRCRISIHSPIHSSVCWFTAAACTGWCGK